MVDRDSGGDRRRSGSAGLPALAVGGSGRSRLLVVPHVVGAPQLAEQQSNVPEALSHQFVVAVTLTSAGVLGATRMVVGRVLPALRRAHFAVRHAAP